MKRKLWILFGILFLYTSCDEDKSTQPTEITPNQPPESSLVMDFNQFPDTSSNAILKGNAVYQNWGFAALNIAVWSSILKVTLAVPVAAYLESFDHEPVLQPDGSWLWSYDVSVNNENYSANLYGRMTEAGTEWRMLISKEGGYTDFEWFTGVSNLPANEGTWTLNKNPDEPDAFLFIEWQRNTGDNTGEIKYTNISAGTNGAWGYIHYGKVEDPDLNLFYNIYNAENTNVTEIEWNSDFHNGRVRDEIHFNDSNWHCWDENLMDINCL